MWFSKLKKNSTFIFNVTAIFSKFYNLFSLFTLQKFLACKSWCFTAVWTLVIGLHFLYLTRVSVILHLNFYPDKTIISAPVPIDVIVLKLTESNLNILGISPVERCRRTPGQYALAQRWRRPLRSVKWYFYIFDKSSCIFSFLAL